MTPAQHTAHCPLSGCPFDNGDYCGSPACPAPGGKRVRLSEYGPEAVTPLETVEQVVHLPAQPASLNYPGVRFGAVGGFFGGAVC